MTPHDFYNAVYSTAIGLGANDTQARLAAAQASEETGFGQHMVGNNLFGIKAGSTYTGPSVSAGTQEEYAGQTVNENANFRSYPGFEDSVRDYLGFIQSNFPDAWSAPSFTDAVQGLNTGVYGKYATRSAYGQHVKAIDGKYGALQYAQEPQNVPTPYGPNDLVDLAGVPNDVIPVADQNFVNADPQFAFAQNPANVPSPEAKPDMPLGGGLLTAFQENPEYSTPFDSILSPSNEWGVINGVAPALNPTVNQWDQVASAPPVSAQMDSVTASGLLGATPALTANATANPMMSLEASGLFGTNPGLSANATVSGLPEVASVSSRMGVADPGFDNSRFDGMPVSVATDFDTGRFADPAPATFDQSRFAGLLDPTTNTQSFMDQPAAAPTAANLGGFPDAYAAQRGPSTGLLSAEMGQRLADIQRQIQNPAMQAPAVTPSYDVAASGLLGGTPALSAQAVANVAAPTAGLLDGMPQQSAPGVFSAYDGARMMAASQAQAQRDLANALSAPMLSQATTNTIPAMATPTNPTAIDPMVAMDAQPASTFDPASLTAPADIARSVQSVYTPSVPSISQTLEKSPGLLSAPGSVLAASPEFTNYTVANSIIGPQPIQQNGFLSGFPDAAVNGTIEPATVNDVVAAPSMDTFQSSTTVDGPATTPALEQQQEQVQQQTVSTPSATQAIAPSQAVKPAGLLQQPAQQQEPQGILGSIANSFQGLLGQPSYSVDPIGSGVQAAYSIWGGGQPIGAQAVATDGQRITSLPGGLTAVTNKYGVTTAFDSTGKGYSVWGGLFDHDTSPTPGGYGASGGYAPS